ncbi:MAG TPA: LPS export ABC transporter permease LptG [Gammaproteobacteria bacterium]
MNRLGNYIVSGVLKGTTIVTVAVVLVGSVIEFVGQLDDVGLGSYGLREALVFVALRIPHKIFDVLPAAALLGALLSLGNMAVHRELVIMRTSGLSQYRLLGAVATAGMVLFVVMLLLGESLAPSLGAYARSMRADALLEDVDTASARSTWFKDGDRIFNLRQPRTGDEFDLAVRVFELDAEAGLTQIAKADSVLTVGSDIWELFDYAETNFEREATTVSRSSRIQQDYGLSPELLELSEVREDLLDTPQLDRYITYLQSNGLDADRYLAAYWGRIANGASVILMAALALPFVMGGLRSAGTGARMLVGLIIGLGYYVLVQLSAQIGEVFSLDPVVAAWAPGALLLLVTGVAVVRLR